MRTKMMILATLVCMFPLVAAAETVTADWCTITAPDEAVVGKAFPVTIEYRDVPEGMKLFCDLHWNRGPAFGGVNVVGRPKAISGSGSYTYDFTIRDKEGMTGVRILAYISPAGYGELTKKATSQLIPTAGAAKAAKPKPAPKPAPKPLKIDVDEAKAGKPAIYDELGLKLTLIDFIDCTDENDPHEMMDMGTSEVVTGPAGKYRITPPHNHAMFSYRYKTAGKDQPVLLVIEYPDDADRCMNFMTHDSTRPYREHHSFSTEAGVYTGLAYPLSGKMKYFPQVVWPQDDVSPLIVLNCNRLNAPAAASKIWVYRIDDMTPLAVDAPVVADQRQLDMFFPLLFLAQRDNFGWKSPDSMAHLADYCNYIGVTRVTAMCYANQSWGAMCTVKAWGADDGGALEETLKVFDEKGVGFIIGIVANSDLGMYGSVLADGKDIVKMSPAEAETAIKAGFKEMIDRYGKYESFKGFSLSSMEAYGFTKTLVDKKILGNIVEYIHSIRPDLTVQTYAGNAYLQSPHMHAKNKSAVPTTTALKAIKKWERSNDNWTEAMGDVVLANWKAWKKHPAKLNELAPGLHVYEQREPDDFILSGAYLHFGRDGQYFDLARADLSDKAHTPYAGIFGTFMEAWIGLKRGVNFWDNKAWTAPEYNPAAEFGRAAWANALANNDRLGISAGGWTVKYFGLDPWMRSFAKALRAMPNKVMETVEATEDARVVVRYTTDAGKRYVYAVSRIPFAQDVVIDGKTYTVEPFGLVSFSDTGSGAPAVELAANAAYAAWLTKNFDAFEALCNETKELDSAAVPSAYFKALKKARGMLAKGEMFEAERTCTYGMSKEIELRKNILAPERFDVPRISGQPSPARMPRTKKIYGGANLQDHVYFPTTWGGEKDLSAKLSMAHDGENLYVLARVLDNVKNPKDEISIRFSKANWRKWDSEHEKFDGPSVRLTSGKVKSIPLKDLGVKPGSSCGFLVVVRDVDNDGNHPTKHSWAVKQAMLIPNQANFGVWNDARVLGELALEE